MGIGKRSGLQSLNPCFNGKRPIFFIRFLSNYSKVLILVLMEKGGSLVGAFNDEFYAYSICVENLSQFQKVKERLNGLNCTFKVNKSVNPFNNAAAWEKHDCGSGDSYLARISSNRKCYIGMFGGQCYIMPTRYKQYGRERDWIVALGVCVID